MAPRGPIDIDMDQKHRLAGPPRLAVTAAGRIDPASARHGSDDSNPKPYRACRDQSDQSRKSCLAACMSAIAKFGGAASAVSSQLTV